MIDETKKKNAITDVNADDDTQDGMPTDVTTREERSHVITEEPVKDQAEEEQEGPDLD